jgi:hypothetical protein
VTPSLFGPADGFDEFWKLYPRRVAKLAAQKAWAKLTQTDADAAIAALPDHVALWSQRRIEHIPHASSWITGRRWDDEITPPRQTISDHEFFRINGYSRHQAELWALEQES